MRLCITFPATALLAFLATVASAGEPPVAPATPAELRATLADRNGKVVLVNFWATWCRPCLKELPELQALEAKLAPRGFELLAVSLDEPADGETVVAPFLARWFPGLRTLIRTTRDMDATVSVLDPAWNEVLPTSYIVGRDGKVAARLQGGKSAAEFEAAVLPLLAAP
jgi:thiol-disulfide isomerase/thioredoxin